MYTYVCVNQIYNERALLPEELLDSLLPLLEGEGVVASKLLLKKRFFIGDNVPKVPHVTTLIQAQIAAEYRAGRTDHHRP